MADAVASENDQPARKPGLYLGEVDLTQLQLEVRDAKGERVPWALVRGELEVQMSPEHITLTIPAEMALRLAADGVLDLSGGPIELGLPNGAVETVAVTTLQLEAGPRGVRAALELGGAPGR